jgi:hypothetical protein
VFVGVTEEYSCLFTPMSRDAPNLGIFIYFSLVETAPRCNNNPI